MKYGLNKRKSRRTRPAFPASCAATELIQFEFLELAGVSFGG